MVRIMRKPLSKKVMGKVDEGWEWIEKRRVAKAEQKAKKIESQLVFKIFDLKRREDLIEKSAVKPMKFREAIKAIGLRRKLAKGTARQIELRLVQLRIQNAILRKKLMKTKKRLALNNLSPHKIDELNARARALDKELSLSNITIEILKGELLRFKEEVEGASARMEQVKKIRNMAGRAIKGWEGKQKEENR